MRLLPFRTDAQLDPPELSLHEHRRRHVEIRLAELERDLSQLIADSYTVHWRAHECAAVSELQREHHALRKRLTAFDAARWQL